MRKLTLVVGALAGAPLMHFASAAAKEVAIHPWCSVNGSNTTSMSGLQQCIKEKPRAQAHPADAGTRRTHRAQPLRAQNESKTTSCVYANFWLICAEK